MPTITWTILYIFTYRTVPASCISSMREMKLKILPSNTQARIPIDIPVKRNILFTCKKSLFFDFFFFFCWTGVNTGISVQIAIIHGEKSTTLHVNDYNVTLNATPILLNSYSNKPWINPEKEVLAPQRPPAPPTDYFQVYIESHASKLIYFSPDTFNDRTFQMPDEFRRFRSGRSIESR